MQPSGQFISNIVLIDDDADDFMVFEEAIKQLNASINVLHISAAKDICHNKSCQVPDMLFLDINMPDRNGFEWLQLIREKGYNFPVVMYSTASNQTYVQQAYAAGAHIYFPKPESFSALKNSLTRLLSLNWQHPDAVRDQFYCNGECKVFGVS